MGDIFGANQYTMTDLVRYIGVFGGIILTHTALMGTVENRWIRLGIGLVVGIALGYALVYVYSALKASENEGE